MDVTNLTIFIALAAIDAALTYSLLTFVRGYRRNIPFSEICTASGFGLMIAIFNMNPFFQVRKFTLYSIKAMALGLLVLVITWAVMYCVLYFRKATIARIKKEEKDSEGKETAEQGKVKTFRAPMSMATFFLCLEGAWLVVQVLSEIFNHFGTLPPMF